MRKRGFTLIELLVAISIIGLLSSIVLVSLNSVRNKGRIAAGQEFDANVYHAAADSAEGLWDFNECSGTQTADLSGAGHTGIFQDNVTLNVNGPTWSNDTPSGTGCSLSFDGVTDSVSISSATFGVNFSISAWIKTTASGDEAVFDNYVYYYFPGDASLRIMSGKVSVVYPSVSPISGNALVNDGLWHNIAAVFDGTNTNIYVDGRLDVTSTVQGSRPLGKNIAQIGRLAAGNLFFAGLIDNVHLYSKTLTASDVRDMYASESSKFKFVAQNAIVIP